MIAIVLEGATPRSPSVPEISSDQTAKARVKLTQALFCGNPKVAVEIAAKNNLWADAFALSFKFCPNQAPHLLSIYGKQFPVNFIRMITQILVFRIWSFSSKFGLGISEIFLNSTL